LHGGLVQPWHVHNWFWFGARGPRRTGHVTVWWKASACAGVGRPVAVLRPLHREGWTVAQRCGETRRDAWEVRAWRQEGAVGEVPG
jgi:hypothetical protein